MGHGIQNSEIVLFEIFAITKYYIFLNKLNSKKNNVDELFSKIRDTFRIEEGLARKEGGNKIKKFNFKWKNFLKMWQREISC